MSSITKRAPCPQCDRGPKDTALAITTDERGTVEFCHRCGFTRAANFERRPTITPTQSSSAEPLDWSDRAEWLWRQTVPLGELARIYLQGRGCMMPPRDGDLRFLPGSERHAPSLCARLTDVVSAKPVSLHFTPLLPDGSGHGERRLLKGHRKKGAVVRLWPDESVTHGLSIAEGLESALAAAHVFAPGWAAVDAGNLAQLPILSGIETLTIFADHDAAGMKAAATCAQRWRAAGREVTVLRARDPGSDAADVAKTMEAAA